MLLRCASPGCTRTIMRGTGFRKPGVPKLASERARAAELREKLLRSGWMCYQHRKLQNANEQKPGRTKEWHDLWDWQHNLETHCATCNKPMTMPSARRGDAPFFDSIDCYTAWHKKQLKVG